MKKKIARDVCVIGAGPSGLAAVRALREFAPNLSVICVDAGKRRGAVEDPTKEQCTTTPFDLAHGLGGAGLWSDGKFSFRPSATRLWTIPGIDASFDTCMSFIEPLGLFSTSQRSLETSEVDERHHEGATAASREESQWHLKEYPSIYLTIEQRRNLIETLYRDGGGSSTFLFDTKVEACEVSERNDMEGNKRFRLSLLRGVGSDATSETFLDAKSLVLCGGRFWPQKTRHGFWNGNTESDWEFRRYEFGLRLQAPMPNQFFDSTAGDHVDPKYLFDTGRYEYRTFCCCRNGLVCETKSLKPGDLVTFSGRADVSPTGVSNIGFNVRVGPDDATDVAGAIARSNAANRLLRNVPLPLNSSDWGQLFEPVYGLKGSQILCEGLEVFFDDFPEFGACSVFGPTLEGVGDYPVSKSETLQVERGVYVAGDATGKFRGIVAAMTSGVHAASHLVRAFETEETRSLALQQQQQYYVQYDRPDLLRVEDMERRLAPLKARMVHHELWNAMTSRDDVVSFMESHCFAVFDFMLMLKFLQSKLTSVDAETWYPPRLPHLARFINEIVLDEESDMVPDLFPQPVSHAEFYLQAMREAGADTTAFLGFLEALRHGSSVETAISSPMIPLESRTFVTRTREILQQRDHGLAAVGAAFAFGREGAIPDMFFEIVSRLEEDDTFRTLIAYLNRHIEIDGESHGPMARTMVAQLCGKEDDAWDAAEQAAEKAMLGRIELWNAIHRRVIRNARDDRGFRGRGATAIEHYLGSDLKGE